MESKMTKRKHRNGWFVLGAAAYTFTHMPQIVAHGVKETCEERRKEKLKRDALNGILMMRKYLDEMRESGEISDEQCENILTTSLIEYFKL